MCAKGAKAGRAATASTIKRWVSICSALKTAESPSTGTQSKRTGVKRLTVVVFFGVISLAGLPMLGRTDSAVRGMTVLRGNTHPMARPEFDHGLAPDSLPMDRMLLVLKRSPEKEA